MADESEIVLLLREIRDLQRAHFERYKEFTADASKRAQDAVERQNQSSARLAEARQIDQQYRDQAQQNVVNARSAANRALILAVVAVCLQVALVSFLGFIILALLKR
jgi:hypothetical protein